MKPTKKKKRDLWKSCEREIRKQAIYGYQWPFTYSADIVRRYAKEAKKK